MTDRLHEPPLVGTGSIGTQPGMEMTEIQAGVADHTITTYEHGLEVRARSQWSYARARFFRHRLAMVGIVLLIVIFVAGAFAGQIAPYDPTLPSADITVSPTFAGHHFFGTDQIGRDYFSRTLYGIRATEQVSLLVAGIASLIGILIGACSGYFGGWIDNLLMRTTDLFLVVPALAVLLVAAKYLGHGSPVRLALLLGLLFWTNIARIVRGSFLSLKEKEYVEAAKASGSGNFRIMFRHILPNTIGPIVVAATLLTGLAILNESTISFLGFGLDLSLGTLIADGQAAGLNLWWLVTMPGLTIVLIILCVNFIGDGLRDALDPTQRRIRA
ncbi:MAG: ABC transporter permease [Actinobacteria bacterium]|nr:MAG: ABC transporter permease [Actinomycetota bacterium]